MSFHGNYFQFTGKITLYPSPPLLIMATLERAEWLWTKAQNASRFCVTDIRASVTVNLRDKG